MNYIRPEPKIPPPFPTPILNMTQSEKDMFWRNIDKRPNGCWYWAGQYIPRGTHGWIWLHGQLHLAHRIAYYLHTGIDPLDHGISFLCLHDGCCNPNHLELSSPFRNGELNE